MKNFILYDCIIFVQELKFISKVSFETIPSLGQFMIIQKLSTGQKLFSLQLYNCYFLKLSDRKITKFLYFCTITETCKLKMTSKEWIQC